eukprot:2422767-Amphidinium_carterae.1
MTVRNDDGFAIDGDVLQALVETFSSMLGVSASQVQVEVVQVRRLAALPRLLTSGSGGIRLDVTITVPAGTGESVADSITELTYEEVETSVVESLESVGIDSELYLPILVEEISEPSVAVVTTTLPSTSAVTSTGFTTSAAPRDQASSGGNEGASGAIIAAVAVPVALVLLVPACVG